MLVLLRRLGETIHIGEDITVEVVAIDRGRVRLGIRAPKNVVVDRAEIHALKQAEKDAKGAA